MDLQTYHEFLEGKRQLESDGGFDPIYMPAFLFDFQQDLAQWAIRKGRAAVMAMPGLGKSPIGYTWGENVIRKTNGRVLAVAPLGVTHSLSQEAAKFGFEVIKRFDGKPARFTLTNFDNLHHFNADDFTGIIVDEASILKNFDGAFKTLCTEFMRRIPYRLLLSGLLSPNDYHELGTSSEALGFLGYTDMLNRFFRNDLNNSSSTRGYLGSSNKWRLRGHAKDAFYRWVCSWGRVARKPSDLGPYDDTRYELPPLIETDTIVSPRKLAEGRLFEHEAITLEEQRDEARRTVAERCERAAECLTSAPCGVGWVNLNEEGDLLTKLVPGAVQVTGSESPEKKEEAFLAFENGEIKHLITKPRIAAWGLNWQHCQFATVFPTHSYEQYFQLVRRFWRFGQTKPVSINRIIAEGGVRVLDNLKRKGEQADVLFAELVRLMNQAEHIGRPLDHPAYVEVPRWAA